MLASERLRVAAKTSGDYVDIVLEVYEESGMDGTQTMMATHTISRHRSFKDADDFFQMKRRLLRELIS
jgi:hypothetical protein